MSALNARRRFITIGFSKRWQLIGGSVWLMARTHACRIVAGSAKQALAF